METNPPPSDSFNEFGYRKKRPARAADDAPRGPRPFRKPYRAGRDDAPPAAEGEGQDFRRPYRPPYRDQDRPPRPYPRRDEREHSAGGFRKPYRPRHDDGQPPRDGAAVFAVCREMIVRVGRGYRKPYRPRAARVGRSGVVGGLPSAAPGVAGTFASRMAGRVQTDRAAPPRAAATADPMAGPQRARAKSAVFANPTLRAPAAIKALWPTTRLAPRRRFS